MNIALARFPLDSFGVAQLAPVNALADSSPGSVWRLQTEVGDATGIRAFGDARPMVNLSVWESVDALRSFVYDSGHLAVIRRRRTWFSRGAEAHQALWWLPAGSLPSVSDAEGHLEHLRARGATPFAFSFKRHYPPPGSDQAHVAPPAVSLP